MIHSGQIQHVKLQCSKLVNGQALFMSQLMPDILLLILPCWAPAALLVVMFDDINAVDSCTSKLPYLGRLGRLIIPAVHVYCVCTDHSTSMILASFCNRFNSKSPCFIVC